MPEVKSAAAGRGAAWLLDGFDYFKKAAGAWIGIVVLLVVFSIIASLIPLGNFVYQIITPVFIGGLVLGCRELDEGREFGVNYLFAEFSGHAAQLATVGALYLVGVVAIMILLMGLALTVFGGMEIIRGMMSGDITAIQHIQGNPLNILVLLLIGLALYVPLLMALWFAPALVVLEEMGAFAAMVASFNGCMKNVIPFLIYGLVGLVLTIVATIPLLLGWLVLIPMLIASIYVSYKDIFQTGAAAA